MAIIPSIELLDDRFAVQKLYEDDGNAVESLDYLKELFDSLKKIWSCYSVSNLTKASCKKLGSVLGSNNAEKKFVERSRKPGKSMLKKLAIHANVLPQNAYKSFISSI